LGSYAESKDAETENCLTLAKARRKAAPVRSMVDNEGIDPIEEEKRQEAARVSREAGSFGALLDLYQTMLEEAGRASAGAVQETLSRHVPVTIRAIPAIRITRHHVMDMMEAVTKSAAERGFSGKRTADMLRGYISSAYEFGIRASVSPEWRKRAKAFQSLEANPAHRVAKFQPQVVVGERNLSNDEVVFLWNKAGVEALSMDLALYLKLALALGGQRATELLHSEWSEFDMSERVWSIPMARRKIRNKAKHKEPHIVPINDIAASLLEQLSPLSGAGVYLFPDQSGKKPRTVDALNQAIKRFCNPQGKSERKPFNHFSSRDIRRTAKTLMGKAGLDKEIRDRIQGHAFGDVASQHYDRYDYLPEKRQALDKWGWWLDQLVTGKKAKVVQLKGAGNG